MVPNTKAPPAGKQEGAVNHHRHDSKGASARQTRSTNPSSADALAEVLSRFPDAKKTSGGWQARCPAHEDNHPSLSISQGPDGRVLLHCHAGCPVENVVKALGVKMADLFSKPRKAKGKLKIVATYDYQDEQGSLLFQVCRTDPKDFLMRKPNRKGGHIWKMAGVRRVPFMLPSLLAAVRERRTIFICEGEKDCLAMQQAGFVSTCNPGGAGKWHASFADYFRKASVVIVADKDEAGRKHAARIAGNLHPVATTVHVVEVPDVNGRPCKDAADYFEAGGKAEDLAALASSTPIWTPPPLITPAPDDAPEFDKITATMRGEILGWLMSGERAQKIRKEISRLVVDTLAKVGRFFFHADLRDFDSCLYFNASTKCLQTIGSDSFKAWLSGWVAINRAETIFHHIITEVLTAALSGVRTTGIVPEKFWATRANAIYLSNGDGSVVKITGEGIASVDNGTDGVLFAAGKTLSPWRLTTPRDPFESCRLFAHAHCEAGHGKDLLQVWLYSLPANPALRPRLRWVTPLRSTCLLHFVRAF